VERFIETKTGNAVKEEVKELELMKAYM